MHYGSIRNVMRLNFKQLIELAQTAGSSSGCLGLSENVVCASSILILSPDGL